MATGMKSTLARNNCKFRRNCWEWASKSDVIYTQRPSCWLATSRVAVMSNIIAVGRPVVHLLDPRNHISVRKCSGRKGDRIGKFLAADRLWPCMKTASLRMLLNALEKSNFIIAWSSGMVAGNRRVRGVNSGLTTTGCPNDKPNWCETASQHCNGVFVYWCTKRFSWWANVLGMNNIVCSTACPWLVH